MNAARGWGLVATLALVISAGGCGPTTGGQSGDPSAYEHRSGVLGPREREPGGGACALHASTLLQTDTLGAAALSWPSSPVGDVFLSARVPGDARSLVLVDATFGVRVADTTDGSLQPGPSLYLDFVPRQVHVLDASRALVVGDGAVWLVGLDGEVPEKLDAIALPGTPQLSSVLAGDDETTLHVLVDIYDLGTPCDPRARSVLVTLAVRADQLVAVDEEALGDDLQVARVHDQTLLLVRGGTPAGLDVPRPSSLQLASLDAQGVELGATVALGGIVLRAADLELEGDEVRVLVADLELLQDRAELLRVDVADANAPIVAQRCAFALRSALSPNLVGDGDAYEALLFAGGVFVRDRVEEGGPADTGRIVRFDGDACDVQEVVLPSAAELMRVGADRVVAVGGSSGSLEVALFEPDASAPALTSVTVDGEAYTYAPRRARIFQDAVAWPGDDGASETTLLLVPYSMETEDSAPHEGMAVLSLSEGTLTFRVHSELLQDATRVGDWLLGPSNGYARMIELVGDSLRGSAVGPKLWPVAETARLLPGAVLARRPTPYWGEAPERFDLLARDALSGEPLSALDLADDVQVARVGERLVVIDPSETCEPGARSALRVLDVSEPAMPRELGSLTTSELWNCWDDRPLSETDWDLHALGDDALVVRALRYIEEGDDEGHDAFGFQVIDLDDPSAPTLAEVELPDEHHGVGALVVGDRIYVTTLVRDGDVDSLRVRYFLHVIDVADRGQPALAEPISVPGEVVAVDGDTLYTRDGVWDRDRLQSLVRRVQLDEQGARILASYEATAPVRSVHLESASLFISLGDSRTRYTDYSQPEPGSLRVLDAQTLEERAQLELAPESVIDRALAGMLVARAYWGVQLIDVSEPDAPAIELELPASRFLDLQGDELLLLHGASKPDAGALRRIDLAAP